MSTTIESARALHDIRMPLNNGRNEIPAIGFGTLIASSVETRAAVEVAMEAGFRHFDCAERYRNEKEIGEAMQEVFQRALSLARVCSSRRNSGTLTTGPMSSPGLWGQPQKAWAGLPRSLPDPYAVRLQAWRRSRPAGCERQADLRRGGHAGRHLERHGTPGREWFVQGDWDFGLYG